MPDATRGADESGTWAALQRMLPPHITSLHYIGGLAIVFFGIQLVTGILLSAYYRPSVGAAHMSIRIITDEVRFGWLVRFVHAWCTHFLIVLVSLHAIRVYFLRAYRGPRSVNWVLGICLLVLTLALAFTGTLLPWDQYAYWYVDSAREKIAGVPLIGNFLLGILWGGWEIGEEVLLRFYALHIGVLPCLSLVVLFLYFWMVWTIGMTDPAAEVHAKGGSPVPLYPDFLLNLLIAALLVTGLLLTAAVVFPPALLPPADPLTPLVDVRPPWYLLPVRETLIDLPGGLATLAVFFFAILIFLVPVFDRRAVLKPWQRLLHRGVGVLIIGGWIALGVRAYLR